ncbi:MULTISPECIES: YitT family protein [Stenotrophomonas]|uniref:YitT family protein n=1 Tax=Stenotrophomonas maltophilia TaxID=40324 RepID=A0A4S2CUZ3_STEMA|nr:MULTISPECIES: YitT family protein [Stenotrophomonas]MBD3827890.1 YitT family protein [Stenotrophomonas sp.]QIO87244.1 membrane protein [Stenotrophomonas rhizophila]TGY32291.1 YitT family protein [Stenotrophomonas maltophilia]
MTSLDSHSPEPCGDADGHLVTAGPLTPPPDSAGTVADEKALRHSVAEDVQGMLLATLVASLGLAIFAKGGLMIGGMAGLAFLAHYAFGWNFGLVFVLVNLPFYWVAVRRMGWEFTLKTFAAVTACGVLTDLLPRWADFAHISSLYSAIVGGALAGLGILFYIRHRASLGGIGILAVYLQRTRGWSAGKVQMSFDTLLMCVAFFVLSPSKVMYSAIGAVVLSLVLMFNHRPGRYMGV